MNSNTEKCEDRFYAKEAPKRKFVPEVGTKFTSTYVNFTKGKDYPVIETNPYEIKFKTINDQGKELWVKDDYFIPSETKLCGDKELGFSASISQSKLCWEGEIKNDEFVPFKSENPKKLNPDILTSAGIPKELSPDVFKLAGVPKEKILFLKTENTKEEQQIKKEKLEKLPTKLCGGGEIKENNLMWDHDKLWDNMGKVFIEYRKIDSDVVIDVIRNAFCGRNIRWNHGCLYIDEAKTNIAKADVDSSFNGLKKLTNPTTAEKMVAKIIVNKLKKLF